jgi:tetratricopeptide (TPR) repeat protein
MPKTTPDIGGEPDEFDRALADCGARLDDASASAGRAESLVDRGLLAPQSTTEFEAARLAVRVPLNIVRELAGQLEELRTRVRELEGHWRSSRRWTSDGIEETVAHLMSLVGRKPEEGARAWIGELLDAIAHVALPAAARIASAPLPWPERLGDGARAVEKALRLWGDEAETPGLELMEQLAAAELPGWGDVLEPTQRARAHRLAAWLYLRRFGDPQRAHEHLDAAIALDPDSGLGHADRAAFFLFVGDLEQALADAQRAIEIAPSKPEGHLYLGTWAELSGRFDEADELYRLGLARMSTWEVAKLPDKAALLDPSGRLLIEGGRRLLDFKRRTEALVLADRALLADLRGPHDYPDSDVYHLRSRALEADEKPLAAAEASLEAGRRFLWAAEYAAAVRELARATALNPSLNEAGWLRADALLGLSLPPGELSPKEDTLRRARTAWEETFAAAGPPLGPDSWAYLTRAVIWDLESYVGGSDRPTALWQSLTDLERAIVHDPYDGQRWGMASRYAAELDLAELGSEMAERAYSLAPDDRWVLESRLTLAASRGQNADALETAERLVRLYGETELVKSVRAWLHFRDREYGDALEALSALLAEAPKDTWYIQLHADCSLGLEEADDARSDFKRILELTERFDDTDSCRAALANAALGHDSEARRWLGAARDDPMTDESEYASTAAFVALMRGELDEARERLAQAIGAARSATDVEDVMHNMRLRLRLASAEVRARGELPLSDAGDQAAARRLTWISEHPWTAPMELELTLEKELARGDSGAPAVIALRALRARRLRATGDLPTAVRAYEELRLSAFEPEATIALASVLHEQARADIASGDVGAVERAMARLAELDAVEPFHAALAISEAMEGAGQIPAAREYLNEQIIHCGDDFEREQLHRRLGMLALRAADQDSAAREFGEALGLARARGDFAEAGQLELRMALLALVNGDLRGAKESLEDAIASWGEAGAFEPLWAAAEELRSIDAEPWVLGLASNIIKVLRGAVETAASRAELGSDTPAELVASALDEVAGRTPPARGSQRQASDLRQDA